MNTLPKTNKKAVSEYSNTASYPINPTSLLTFRLRTNPTSHFHPTTSFRTLHFFSYALSCYTSFIRSVPSALIVLIVSHATDIHSVAHIVILNLAGYDRRVIKRIRRPENIYPHIIRS